MITERDIQELSRSKRFHPPVVSLFLNTDKGTPDGERSFAVTRHLFSVAHKNLARLLGEKDTEEIRRLHDVVLPQILEKVEQGNTTIRGVALFAALGGEKPFIHILELPRPVRSQVHVEHTPFLRPLLWLLDEYERVLGAVLHREDATLFSLFLGEVEHTVHIHSDVPQKQDEGGWSQSRFQRHTEQRLKEHLKKIVHGLTTLHAKFPAKRIALGGNHQLTAVVQSMLPDSLQALVVGRFETDTKAPFQESIEKTMSLSLYAEHAEEAELVRALLEEHGATRGLEETLRALSEKRVHLLLVQRGFHTPGYRCPNCEGRFVEDRLCAFCGHRTTHVEDIVEDAIELARHEGAGVEFVTESLDLEAMGHIGAQVRF